MRKHELLWRVLASTIISVWLSICLSLNRPSHGWISQKWFKLESPVFTVGSLEDFSFRMHKAFP